MRARNLVWPAALSDGLPLTDAKLLLHPTDLTEVSEKAFAVAVSLAKRHSAELVVVYALPPPTPIFERASPLRPDAEVALARLAEVARDFGVSARRVLIDSNAPVSTSIMRCAEDLRADMIVMGTNRKTGFSRWLVGSHAARVIARARCPVVVVRDYAANPSNTD
jgi:nucleotide-binding universal stress UspA family protein